MGLDLIVENDPSVSESVAKEIETVYDFNNFQMEDR